MEFWYLKWITLSLDLKRSISNAFELPSLTTVEIYWTRPLHRYRWLDKPSISHERFAPPFIDQYQLFFSTVARENHETEDEGLASAETPYRYAFRNITFRASVFRLASWSWIALGCGPHTHFAYHQCYQPAASRYWLLTQAFSTFFAVEVSWVTQPIPNANSFSDLSRPNSLQKRPHVPTLLSSTYISGASKQQASGLRMRFHGFWPSCLVDSTLVSAHFECLRKIYINVAMWREAHETCKNLVREFPLLRERGVSVNVHWWNGTLPLFVRKWVRMAIPKQTSIFLPRPQKAAESHLDTYGAIELVCSRSSTARRDSSIFNFQPHLHPHNNGCR